MRDAGVDPEPEPDGEADLAGAPAPAEQDHYRRLLADGFPNRRLPEGRTSAGTAVLCADPSRDRVEVHLRIGADGRIEDLAYRPLTLMGVAAEVTADLLCRVVREDGVGIDALDGLRAARFLELLGGPGPRVLHRTGPAMSTIYQAAIRHHVRTAVEASAGGAVGPGANLGEVLGDGGAEARGRMEAGLASLGLGWPAALLPDALSGLTVKGLGAALILHARSAVTARLVAAGCRFPRNFDALYAP